MLTNWISPDALKSLNEGFVVAIMLEAREGQADALAEILRVLTPPTMAEPGVKLFLPYRSPTNPLSSLSSSSTSTRPLGARTRRPTISRPRSRSFCQRSPDASACPSFRFSPIEIPAAPLHGSEPKSLFR
jgi:hypothetical protein